MAVSEEYREWVLEQLGRVVPVTSRSMFGGVGIYSEGIFFGLMDDDLVYLKVDDTNREDFESVGKGPFRPFGEDSKPMQYYELPGELLEDPERLRPWIAKALDVARRKGQGKKS
ncbi:MAG: TfoX/Sxy family protein [Gemmatimonadota bacterium]